jgi:alkylhydroperoxidase family enzyme
MNAFVASGLIKAASGTIAAYRDIWDVAAVAGFFNMSNRVASATDMRPNSVYHGQGRDQL